MISSKHLSTRYTTNFARLCRLLSVCAGLLRDVLRHFIPEISFHSELDTAKGKIMPLLNSPQKELLYHSRKSSLSCDDLDTAISYILLRNLCDENTHKLQHGQKGMRPPQNGWGKNPFEQDRSLAANIERIRWFRNIICHREKDSVADCEFIIIWTKMKRVVEEIEKELNNQIRPTEYRDILKTIKDISMDPEESQKYIEKIEKMKREQDDLEEKIHKEIKKEMSKYQKSQGSKRDNQIARTNAFIEKEYNNLQQYFVETKAFSSVMEHLCTFGFVVVKGNPGDGKTTLSVFILKCLKDNGKIPIQIRSPSDWDEFISPDQNLLIFMDNMFGEISVSQTEVTDWSSRFSEIKSSVGSNIEGTDNMIIITIRNDIYEECKKSLKDESFFQETTVDISDKEHKLSTKEMGQLLERYVSKDIYQSCMIESDKFFADVPNLGFPQCCRLFKDNTHFENEFPSFFKNPLHFLKECFKKYIQNKEMKMAVLTFVLMQGGKVEKNVFERRSNLQQLKKEAMNMCELGPDLNGFQSSINSFIGSYLIFDIAEEYYKFSHSSVESSLFMVLGDLCDVDKLVSNCAHNLLKYLTTRNCPRYKMDTLMIDKENFECVFVKIISLIDSRIPAVYACLAELVLWNDESFHEEFLDIVLERGREFLTCVDEESKSMVVHFAAAGNVKWVKDINENVQEQNFKDQNYLSLNAACEHNQLNIVEYLLKLGVAPDIKSCFHAVKGGNFNIIKMLADRGVEMKERTYSLTPRWKNKPDTVSVLDEACLRGQNHLVLDLLSLCPDLLYTKNEAGEYSLLFVAYSGATDTLKVLIVKGLNPLEKSSIESTILHCACQGGKLETFQYIVRTYPELLSREHDNSTQGTLLHRTAEGGNISILEMLVEKGKNIYSRTTDGKTVLHKACKEGRFDMCNYLVNTYSKLLQTLDSSARSPIHDAGLGGNVELLELLCSQKLEVKSLSNDGKTILHYACSNGRISLCKYLIKKYPFLSDIRDKNGLYAVHEAAWSGNVELFKFLVQERKRTLHFKTTDGRTVLHQAAAGGNLELSKYLLEKEPNFLSGMNEENMTVLHAAASGGNIQLFIFFLERGLLPKCKTVKGQTVLHFACKEGKLLMSKYLISAYSQLLDDVDNEGYSAAHFAAKSGNTQLLTLLQENGADVQLRSNLGETPLHLASKESKIDTCKYLLETTKTVEILTCKDRDGVSVLHSAASGGYVNLFELYISKGLSIIDKTAEGKTVLNYAARHCRMEMCEYVIAKNKEFVENIDDLGESVLHDVARGGNVEIFKMFIDLGMDVFRVNKVGETVMHIACSNKNFKFCDYVYENFPNILEKEDNEKRTVLKETVHGSFPQTHYKFSS